MKVRRRAFPLFPTQARGAEDIRRNQDSRPRPSGSHIPRMQPTAALKARRAALATAPATKEKDLPKMPDLYTRSELSVEDLRPRDIQNFKKWNGVGPYDGRVKAGKMRPDIAALKAKVLAEDKAKVEAAARA
jgi:hypothetical protein